MSKISLSKSFDAYPPSYFPNGGGVYDANMADRAVYEKGYEKGYDQAMKYIKEFIYDKFNIHPHDCHVVQYESDKPLEDLDDFVEQFETYVKDESEN